MLWMWSIHGWGRGGARYSNEFIALIDDQGGRHTPINCFGFRLKGPVTIVGILV